MNIYEKVDNLIKSLDRDKDIVEIKKIQNQILKDEKLLKDLKEKKKIDNELVIKYKHLENLINYKILSINKELKTIVGEKK